MESTEQNQSKKLLNIRITTTHISFRHSTVQNKLLSSQRNLRKKL